MSEKAEERSLGTTKNQQLRNETKQEETNVEAEGRKEEDKECKKGKKEKNS